MKKIFAAVLCLSLVVLAGNASAWTQRFYEGGPMHPEFDQITAYIFGGDSFLGMGNFSVLGWTATLEQPWRIEARGPDTRALTWDVFFPGAPEEVDIEFHFWNNGYFFAGTHMDWNELRGWNCVGLPLGNYDMVAQPVPEPATLLLLAGSLIAIGRRKGFFKK